MTRARLALLASAALLLPLALPGRAAALIQVDRGIAGARLGNTRAEVRAALGRPTSIRTGTNKFGPWVRYRYRRFGITVIFQGRERVTSVSTTGLGDRTRRGVGVRSSERSVRRRVAGVRCRTIEGERLCHTGRLEAGDRVTVFFLRGGRVTRVDVGIVID